MNKSPSFFLKTFIILSCMIALLMGASWLAFTKIFLAYSEERIGESRMASARGMEKHIEQLTDSLSRDAMHLSLLIQDAYLSASESSKLASLKPNSKEAGYYQIMYMRDVYNILLKTVRSNPRFYSVYLYLKESEHIISSDSQSAPAASFSDVCWLDVYRAQEKPGMWLDTRSILPFSSQSRGGGAASSQKVISYVHEISNYTTPFIQGVLVFNLHERNISSLINDESADKTERMTIITGEGTVVSDTQKPDS